MGLLTSVIPQQTTVQQIYSVPDGDNKRFKVHDSDSIIIKNKETTNALTRTVSTTTIMLAQEAGPKIITWLLLRLLQFLNHHNTSVDNKRS